MKKDILLCIALACLLTLATACGDTITESKSTCGDPFICEAGENSQNCPSDCGDGSTPCNNNGVCDAGENALTCADCFTSGPPATVNATLVIGPNACNAVRCVAGYAVSGSGIASVMWTFSTGANLNETGERTGDVFWNTPSSFPFSVSAKVVACSTTSREPDSCATERTVNATFTLTDLPPPQCAVTASESTGSPGTFLLSASDTANIIDLETCNWLGSQNQTARGQNVTLIYDLDGATAGEWAKATCHGAGGIFCVEQVNFDVD